MNNIKKIKIETQFKTQFIPQIFNVKNFENNLIPKFSTRSNLERNFETI